MMMPTDVSPPVFVGVGILPYSNGRAKSHTHHVHVRCRGRHSALFQQESQVTHAPRPRSLLGPKLTPTYQEVSESSGAYRALCMRRVRSTCLDAHATAILPASGHARLTTCKALSFGPLRPLQRPTNRSQVVTTWGRFIPHKSPLPNIDYDGRSTCGCSDVIQEGLSLPTYSRDAGCGRATT